MAELSLHREGTALTAHFEVPEQRWTCRQSISHPIKPHEALFLTAALAVFRNLADVAAPDSLTEVFAKAKPFRLTWNVANG